MATKKKTGMDAFNVAKMSNEGVKLPLMLPDGTETDEYLIVGGADSKAFRGRMARANRDRLKLLKDEHLDPATPAHKTEDIDRDLVATLIVGWSFDESFEHCNVVKFLADAPQIQEQVDKFAGNRANFFVKPPQD